MRIKTFLLISSLSAWTILNGQGTKSDQDLARLLANETSQQAAVATLVATGNEKIPLLVTWTRTPPILLDEFERYIFDIGLADVFGRLKAKEAIPFLIQNIGILRWPRNFPQWRKSPAVIEAEMPAVGALIRVGPPALIAILQMPYAPSALDDRLARIFVVSMIASEVEGQNRERAREFLNSALSQANLECSLANDGLKLLTDTSH